MKQTLLKLTLGLAAAALAVAGWAFGMVVPAARADLSAEVQKVAGNLAYGFTAQAVVALQLNCGGQTSTPTYTTALKEITSENLLSWVAPGCDLVSVDLRGWRLTPPVDLETPALRPGRYRDAKATVTTATKPDGQVTVTVTATAQAGLLPIRLTAKQQSTHQVAESDQANARLQAALKEALPLLAVRDAPTGTGQQKPNVTVEVAQPPTSTSTPATQPATAPAKVPAKPLPPPTSILDMEKIRQDFGTMPQQEAGQP